MAFSFPRGMWATPTARARTFSMSRSGAYLDLGQFYDVAALRPKREVLADLTAKYRAQYAIAYKALAEAKRLHDDLEAVYNPHVNFDGVYALAKEHILRLQTEN